jgi:hypothetical protein
MEGEKIGKKNPKRFLYILRTYYIHTNIYIHIYIHTYTYQTKTEEEEEEEEEGVSHIYTQKYLHTKKNTSPIKRGGRQKN